MYVLFFYLDDPMERDVYLPEDTRFIFWVVKRGNEPLFVGMPFVPVDSLNTAFVFIVDCDRHGLPTQASAKPNTNGGGSHRKECPSVPFYVASNCV